MIVRVLTNRIIQAIGLIGRYQAIGLIGKYQAIGLIGKYQATHTKRNPA